MHSVWPRTRSFFINYPDFFFTVVVFLPMWPLPGPANGHMKPKLLYAPAVWTSRTILQGPFWLKGNVQKTAVTRSIGCCWDITVWLSPKPPGNHWCHLSRILLHDINSRETHWSFPVWRWKAHFWSIFPEYPGSDWLYQVSKGGFQSLLSGWL